MIFEVKMELVGNLKTNDTSNIGMLQCDSKSGPIEFYNNAYVFLLLCLNSPEYFQTQIK